jgi:hypothetical protein
MLDALDKELERRGTLTVDRKTRADRPAEILLFPLETLGTAGCDERVRW